MGVVGVAEGVVVAGVVGEALEAPLRPKIAPRGEAGLPDVEVVVPLGVDVTVVVTPFTVVLVCEDDEPPDVLVEPLEKDGKPDCKEAINDDRSAQRAARSRFGSADAIKGHCIGT